MLCLEKVMRGNFRCHARRLQVYMTLTVLLIKPMVSEQDSVGGQSAALDWILKGSKKHTQVLKDFHAVEDRIQIRQRRRSYR